MWSDDSWESGGEAYATTTITSYHNVFYHHTDAREISHI